MQSQSTTRLAAPSTALQNATINTHRQGSVCPRHGVEHYGHLLRLKQALNTSLRSQSNKTTEAFFDIFKSLKKDKGSSTSGLGTTFGHASFGSMRGSRILAPTVEDDLSFRPKRTRRGRRGGKNRRRYQQRLLEDQPQHQAVKSVSSVGCEALLEKRAPLSSDIKAQNSFWEDYPWSHRAKLMGHPPNQQSNSPRAQKDYVTTLSLTRNDFFHEDASSTSAPPKLFDFDVYSKDYLKIVTQMLKPTSPITSRALPQNSPKIERSPAVNTRFNDAFGYYLSRDAQGSNDTSSHQTKTTFPSPLTPSCTSCSGDTYCSTENLSASPSTSLTLPKAVVWQQQTSFNFTGEQAIQPVSSSHANYLHQWQGQDESLQFFDCSKDQVTADQNLHYTLASFNQHEGTACCSFSVESFPRLSSESNVKNDYEQKKTMTKHEVPPENSSNGHSHFTHLESDVYQKPPPHLQTRHAKENSDNCGHDQESHMFPLNITHNLPMTHKPTESYHEDRQRMNHAGLHETVSEYAAVFCPKSFTPELISKDLDADSALGLDKEFKLPQQSEIENFERDKNIRHAGESTLQPLVDLLVSSRTTSTRINEQPSFTSMSLSARTAHEESAFYLEEFLAPQQNVYSSEQDHPFLQSFQDSLGSFIELTAIDMFSPREKKIAGLDGTRPPQIYQFKDFGMIPANINASPCHTLAQSNDGDESQGPRSDNYPFWVPYWGDEEFSAVTYQYLDDVCPDQTPSPDPLSADNTNQLSVPKNFGSLFLKQKEADTCRSRGKKPFLDYADDDISKALLGTSLQKTISETDKSSIT